MLDSPNLDIYLNATLEPIEIPAFPYTLRQKALGRRTSPSNAKSLLCLADGHTLAAALITSVTMGRAVRYWSAPSKHKLSHPNAASRRYRHISIWRNWRSSDEGSIHHSQYSNRRHRQPDCARSKFLWPRTQRRLL